MPLSLTVDRDAPQPLYCQIAGQIRAQIGEGRLPPGAKLPAIRVMAQALHVTRLTVQTAYDELRAGGWIETAAGKGTYVAATAQPEALMKAVSQAATPDGVLGDLPRINQISRVRSFASSEPDPQLLPDGVFWRYLMALRPHSAALFRYGWAQGEPELRTALTALLRERGIESMPDDLIITSGATQAAALIVQALTRPGDAVLVERPVHLGLLNILRAHHLEIVEVPLDADGPPLDEVERAVVQRRPRFFYTVPNFHNPTGTLASAERRAGLLSLARRHGLMLIEDDTCGLLAYDGEPPSALKTQDEADQIIHLSSLSRVLMPGLRIGYLLAPQPLRARLITLRQAADHCAPPLMQRALADFLAAGELRAHLRRVLPVYKGRRSRLMHALSAHMPPGAAWTRPAGGFSCWVTLPPGVQALDVQREALRRGFAFTLGDAFLPNPGQGQHLRICFASQPEAYIIEAVKVLAEIIN